jgi:hypothetical protein
MPINLQHLHNRCAIFVAQPGALWCAIDYSDVYAFDVSFNVSKLQSIGYTLCSAVNHTHNVSNLNTLDFTFRAPLRHTDRGTYTPTLWHTLCSTVDRTHSVALSVAIRKPFHCANHEQPHDQSY